MYKDLAAANISEVLFSSAYLVSAARYVGLVTSAGNVAYIN